MDEIILQNKNGQIVVSSRDVAEKFNKRHDHVLRDIDNLINRNTEYKANFIKSSYIDSYKRYMPMYLIDKEGVNVLINKYSLHIQADKYESNFKELLHKMFQKTVIIDQYPIHGYKIDFFMPDVNIVIEYDEPYHESKKQSSKDLMREHHILNVLNQMVVNGIPLYDGQPDVCESPWLDNGNIFTIIRVKQGYEIDGIREICKTITEEMMRPCSDFM